MNFNAFFPFSINFSIANRVIPNHFFGGNILMSVRSPSLFTEMHFEGLLCFRHSKCLLQERQCCVRRGLNVWGKRWWVRGSSLLLWSIFKIKLKEWPNIFLLPSLLESCCVFETKVVPLNQFTSLPAVL